MPLDPALLPELLPAWTFGFMLLACRFGAAVIAMPGLGEAEVPITVKAAIALALAGLLWPIVSPSLPPPPGAPAEAAALVVGETLIGAWIGLMARLVILALPIAAQIIGFLLGLSSAAQFDPTFGAAGTALSRLMGLAAIVVMFATGLHAMPLAALAGSYAVFPAGAAFATDIAAEQLVLKTAATFTLGFQLAAPFIVVGIVFQVALGLMARIVPQIQVFFVAIPAQIGAGLLLLAAVTASMLSTWARLAAELLAGLPGL